MLASLRAGDEAAFAALVTRYHAAMIRVAMVYVGNRAVAEDVAQETWLGVLQGVARFEGRSALKTWIFSILLNRAKTRARRENRSVPFSVFGDPAGEGAEPAVPASRFRGPNDPLEPGHWAAPPRSWGGSPEERLLARETLGVVARAIDALPPAQREVITLRDVEGWTAEETCNILGISDTNQRVLLHRARSRVRAALEDHLR